MQELAADPTLTAGETVLMTGQMVLTEPVIFTVPLNLQVEGPVTCYTPIRFETTAEGTITVDAAPGVDDSMLDLRFDTPNCHVVWPDSPWLLPETEAETVAVPDFSGAAHAAKGGCPYEPCGTGRTAPVR